MIVYDFVYLWRWIFDLKSKFEFIYVFMNIKNVDVIVVGKKKLLIFGVKVNGDY